MIDLNKTFEHENLIIRPLKLQDFEEMKSLTSDLSMWKYFTSDLSDEQELKSWIYEGVVSNRLALTIIDAKTNAIIGSTSIGNISENDKRVEIGWTWLSKEFQGKAYNLKVKEILVNYCVVDCGVERIEFKTDILNIAARKSLIKLGAVEEGVLRSHTLMTNNRRRDTIYYSILKAEWLSIKNK